jgi:hypothetical protein
MTPKFLPYFVKACIAMPLFVKELELLTSILSSWYTSTYELNRWASL